MVEAAKLVRIGSLLLRGVVVAAAVLFLARGVRFSDVLASVRRASVPLLVLVVVLNGGMMAVKALRLRLLLRPAEASIGVCFLALLTSSALNNVTPLRGGDVARLFMLERRANVTKAAAIAVTLVEKVIELAALALLASIAALDFSAQRWALVAGPLLLAGAVATLILLRLAARRPVRSPVARAAGGRIRARLARWLDALAPGTRALGQRGIVVRSALLSLLGWAFEATMVCVCARALALPISPGLALIVLFGTNLAIALPSAPASAGPFEGAMVVVLVLAGLGKGAAIAFALVYHALLVVPVTVFGLIVVTRVGLTLGGAARPTDRAPAALALD